MGGTACKGAPNSNKAITIAILGLDNAGKTTTARVLEKAPVDSVTPTVGFSQTEITHKNEKIKLIDLGGAKTFREAWRHYYDDAYGFVYVLDSSEEERLGENRDVLRRLLQEDKVKGKPILILANKQDKAEALDKNTILEDLKIERLVNENQTLCRVELCTAKAMSRDGKNSKIDESIRHGFDWLIKIIYENYDTLHKRVESDVKKRNEAELKEKRERQERVKKLREEREKEEGIEKDNDDDTMKNGFVPINQAVKNAERNSSEKPAKDRSNHRSFNETTKITNENKSFPPLPAPRSSSHNRKIINDEDSDDQERPRRNSSEFSTQRKQSPIPRSVSSNFDDNERINSTDEQTTTRAIPGKKKKLIGASRTRSHGDNLPPLAPSSAASRRDDFTLNKGPPAGTPRPQPLVAQWAITSPTPRSTADKLTTIASDNELDDDDNRSKPNNRIVSPHPKTTNRIIHDKKDQYNSINTDDDKNHKRPSRQKYNNDDDDDYITKKSSSIQKSRSKLSDEDDESDNNRKKSNSREQDRFTKQRYDRNNDNDDDEFNNVSNRRSSSSTRKTAAGDSSHRSHSRTNGNFDDDLR